MNNMFMFYTTKYMHFKALSLKSKYSILFVQYVQEVLTKFVW